MNDDGSMWEIDWNFLVRFWILLVGFLSRSFSFFPKISWLIMLCRLDIAICLLFCDVVCVCVFHLNCYCCCCAFVCVCVIAFLLTRFRTIAVWLSQYNLMEFVILEFNDVCVFEKKQRNYEKNERQKHIYLTMK